jgi:hypothetical protein
VIASVATVLLFVGFWSRRLFPVQGGLVLGEKRITPSLEGLHQSSKEHESLFRWPLVRGIGETQRHLFIMLERNAGVIIARSSFSTAKECSDFLAEVRRLPTKKNALVKTLMPNSAVGRVEKGAQDKGLSADAGGVTAALM